MFFLFHLSMIFKVCVFDCVHGCKALSFSEVRVRIGQGSGLVWEGFGLGLE